jgi:phosphoglycerate kinase
VIGGGETIEFINKLGWVEKFSHVSTGGSALLFYLAGEKLPGIEALK